MARRTLQNFTVSHSRATEQIADALQDAIVSGELAPGARIRESALATELGVSRNTVREAVLMLQRTGLIAHEVNRGTVVRPLDLAAVRDLYRVREVLELSAVRAVTPGTDLSAVETAVAELRAAAHGGVVDATVQRDLAFHGSIVALLSSPRLDDFFSELRKELRFYLSTVSIALRESDSPEELTEQHAVVLRALQAGDRDHAAQLLGDHIRLNAEHVASLLSARTAASSDPADADAGS